MNPEMISTTRRPSLRPLVVAIALAGATCAWADEPNPYFIGVSEAVTHTSNVYSATNAIADTYYSTGLLGGIDQPFGRQHFYANGNVQLNRFSKEDSQNNTSYGLRSGLDWSTIGRVSGNVSLLLNQGLAKYTSNANPLEVGQKNVQTSNQFAAGVKWGAQSLLSLTGGVTHSQLRYSALEFKPSNVTQDGINAGVIYRPSALLSLGAAVRHTRGRYPELTNSNGGEYAFDRNDLDLTTIWNASGRSTVDGRISIGRQRYNDASSRDFSGLTGSLAWAYAPTGKLNFTTTLTRDTGSETSFLGSTTGTTPTDVNGDNSRITNAINVNARYLATGKITLTSTLRYTSRSLVDTLAATGAGQSSLTGRDTVRSVLLGVSYAPARSWLLACNVGHDVRSASDDALTNALSYNFSANTVGCSAQFTLQ